MRAGELVLGRVQERVLGLGLEQEQGPELAQVLELAREFQISWNHRES